MVAGRPALTLFSFSCSLPAVRDAFLYFMPQPIAAAEMTRSGSDLTIGSRGHAHALVTLDRVARLIFGLLLRLLRAGWDSAFFHRTRQVRHACHWRGFLLIFRLFELLRLDFLAFDHFRIQVIVVL